VAVADQLIVLGELLQRQGDLAAARQHLEQALAVRRKVSGDQHPGTLKALVSLVETLGAAEEFRSAWPYAERAVAVATELYGPQHIETAAVLDALAEFSYRAGDFARADKLWTQAVEIARKAQGEDAVLVAVRRAKRTAALVRRGDRLHAEEELKALSKAPPNDALFELARVHAVLSAAIAADDSLPAQVRGKQREELERQAIQVLTRAEMAGIFKQPTQRQRLTHDPDLESIRKLSQFNALRERVDAKGP
jgi:tetratricopeptide (TPR) repeat protein